MITHQASDFHNSPNIEGFYPAHNKDEAAYRSWRNAVYEELELANMPLLAHDWLNCSTSYATYELEKSNPHIPENVRGVYVCSETPSHYAKAVCFTCHCRACPDCSRRETARLLDRYKPLVTELSENHSQRFTFKHIILTTRLDLESPDIVSDIQALFVAIVLMFDMLLKDGWRKKQGFIVTCEFGSDGKKLHFHVFFYGQYIPQVHLSDLWNWCNGGLGKIVHIHQIRSGNEVDKLIEQVKYVTKFWSRDEDGNVIYLEPHLVPVLIRALVGVRRVKSYGIFYKVEKKERPSQCKTCEAALTRWHPLEWSIFVQTGFTPGEQRDLLHLKPGNNFFSHERERDKSSPSEVPRQEVLFNVWNSSL